MEFAEVVRRRRMVRSYAEEPVAADVLDRVVATALRGPSAGFTQGTSLLVLTGPDEVAGFWSATSEPDAASAWLDGMRGAPVVVVVWADEAAYRDRYAEADKAAADQGFDVPWWHVDAGMAALLLLQACVDEGLGACFFGVPGRSWDALRVAYGVPDGLVPTGAVTVGHPAAGAVTGSPARRARRGADELVHRGRWGR
ncbi:nitroreductase family protein [Nocardioides sp. CFH 31398]|uniref:nitroreductase family protein n=1 Tax=Nocardioides sp. CFH 31398 TaxID=2919579 RepID=UPI001F06D4BA|nr:nitroreductase family protein [Nocardioides sp. CFH 31398]MCH1865008.1 nitroreductase family protein [Nocardioides sp. CFH 31398]